jgi:hypothetical protein
LFAATMTPQSLGKPASRPSLIIEVRFRCM